MKVLIILVSSAVFASAMYYPGSPDLHCHCPPAPPICASNYKTYNGVCAMNCELNMINIYKLYDGPCRYRYYNGGQPGPYQQLPLGAGMRRNLGQEMPKMPEQNLHQQLQQNLLGLRRNLELELQQDHQQNLQQNLQQPQL